LARADCLVLVSDHEGLPMAVLEAMAAGLPVVVTRVGALPEAVRDGREGFLIDVGDVEALAERLVRLGDPALRRRMGAAGAHRAREQFSLEAMAEQLMNLYGALTRKAPA
jgi:glycosyltransferase involved in cell wall biosynthesis